MLRGLSYGGLIFILSAFVSAIPIVLKKSLFVFLVLKILFSEVSFNNDENLLATEYCDYSVLLRVKSGVLML